MTANADPFIEHSLHTSMFFPESRLFVAGNPKAAGTSLRWWLLETHGVDVAKRTARSLWGESAPYQTVWDGRVDLDFTWNDLAEEERSDALSATDVLTVEAIRHPTSRAFSAWAGKYLTLEPYYNERLPDGFPAASERVDSAEQITEMFAEFMQSLSEYVATEPEWTGVDVHFWPQHRLLGRRPVGETLLLRQEDMKSGLDKIVAHLKTQGVSADPMPRLNENVVPYLPEFVNDASTAAIARVYEEDFARWNYLAANPPGSQQELDLPWLNDLRGRNRRYGVIHDIAIRNRRRVAALNEELDKVRRELRQAKDREEELTNSHSWKVTQPLRAATGRLKKPKG